jgi:hypothetical protein
MISSRKSSTLFSAGVPFSDAAFSPETFSDQNIGIPVFNGIDVTVENRFLAHCVDKRHLSADNSMLPGMRSTPSSWCRMPSPRFVGFLQHDLVHDGCK